MKKSRKDIVKKCLNIISTVLVVIIVLCTVILVGARLVGLNAYTIVSGSMEPAYRVGDLIYVKKVDASTVKVGDAITFVLNENLVVATHRVIEIDTDTEHFVTKGDNNQVADISPVHFKNLIGKPIFRIPYLGCVSDFIKEPPGLYVALSVGVAALGLVFIPDLFKKAKEEENTEKENTDGDTENKE